MPNFHLQYDPTTGGIANLSHPTDPHQMNWVEGAATWGTIQNGKLTSFTETAAGCIATYETRNLTVTVTREVIGDKLRETYVLKNRLSTDVFLRRGDFGIYATFNDNYELAETCMTNRCHTHLWCGGQTSWVYAMKMGVADYGLGLVLTAGSLDCYSVERDLAQYSNDRGDFILHPSPMILLPGAETTIAWELFWYREGTFFQELEKYPTGIRITSDAFTIFEDEQIDFTVHRPNAKVYLGKDEVPTQQIDGKTHVTFPPASLGEHIFTIEVGGIRTKAEFYVQQSFRDLVRNRVKFITEKQQYHQPGSPIDGAYLIYDNEEESMYFDNILGDYNASRERLVMGLLVAKYLQYEPDPAVYESLMAYYRFVTREFYNEETGEVFDSVGMDPTRKRLYNAPWMSMFVMEMYKLTGDKGYLQSMCRLLDVYYTIGGERFYPNGLTMLETVNALRDAGMDTEADALLEKYKIHVGNIVAIGMNYPPHEVKYEQTIVSPGAALTAQMCLLTGDKSLIPACKQQVEHLERFHGDQPSYHLNQLAIRHWDAYWFGKRQQFGDTFPHAASIHSSDAFLQYAEISGDEKYRHIAWCGMRNNLCVYRPDGRAYSSYVYPFRINGSRGEFYDPYANEQDGVLYFIIKYFGLLDN